MSSDVASTCHPVGKKATAALHGVSSLPAPITLKRRAKALGLFVKSAARLALTTGEERARYGNVSCLLPEALLNAGQPVSIRHPQLAAGGCSCICAVADFRISFYVYRTAEFRECTDRYGVHLLLISSQLHT